jgi:hypothetical protein
MSYGGRTILINSSLTNSSIYDMSMFLDHHRKSREAEKKVLLAGR